MAIEQLPSRWDDMQLIREMLGDDAALRHGIPPQDYYTGLFDPETVFRIGIGEAVMLRVMPPIEKADLEKCNQVASGRLHVLHDYSMPGPTATTVLVNAPRSRARDAATDIVHLLSKIHDENVAATTEDMPAPDQAAN